MKRTNPMLRRVLATAAGLVIGLGGTLAVTAPAQATGGKSHEPVVVTQPDCETGTGTIKIPHSKNTKWYEYAYKLDGEPAAAGEHTLAPGSYEVTKHAKKKLRGAKWKQVSSWTLEIVPPGECEEEEDHKKPTLPEPGVTQPDCETLTGVIDIPAAERKALFYFTINGEKVDRPSSHVVEPGSYEVSAVGKLTKKVYKTWLIEIVAAEDCEEDDTPGDEDEDEVPPPADEETPEEPAGDGGELPVTGSATTLVAGGALALLALGGGLFLLARRRRVSFTA